MIPALLILVFLVQCAWFIRTQSLTVDEPVHILAGLEGWHHDVFVQWNDHPPLARLWCTLPLLNPKWTARVVPKVFAYGDAVLVGPDPVAMANRARPMNIVFGLILAAVLWFTARAAFSVGAANLALALFALSPSMIANFSMVTTDGVAAVFVFATAVYLVRWKRNPSIGRTVMLGVILGLLLLSKFSTPVMYALAIFWMLVTKPDVLFVANPRRWNWGKPGARRPSLFLSFGEATFSTYRVLRCTTACSPLRFLIRSQSLRRRPFISTLRSRCRRASIWRDSGG